MKICFVLPQVSKDPVGGYKIVFEYANRLVKDNFDVSIVFINDNAFKLRKIPHGLKHLIINVRTQIQPRWFPLDKRIKKISSVSKSKMKNIAENNIVVATDSTTVDFVLKYFPKSKKFYLIQGYETWNMSKDELYKTYNLGFKKIVVSKWLKKIVDDHSDTKSIYIQNPININKYKINTPISQRNKYILGMLYHESAGKGCKYTLKAIENLRKKYPKLQLIMFGTPKKPQNLPSWISYYRNATQEQTISIYNKISIFAVGALNEGFGLTGLEAMACGAALITTDFPAVYEYAENKETALISHRKNVREMEKNIDYLIQNNDYRCQLAEKGAQSAKAFSWESAYNKFKKAILG